MQGQYDPKILSELFDGQPQAVFWLKPVWSKEPQPEIIDFEYTYLNDEALHYLNFSREQIKDLRLSFTPTVNDELRKQVFGEMIEIYQTGARSETNLYNPALGKYAKVLRKKVMDGILIVLQDVTKEQKLLKEVEQREAFANSILDASLNAIYVAEAIRNKEGKITDFKITKGNKRFTELTGISENQFRDATLLSRTPGIIKNGFFTDLCHVVNASVHVQKEANYQMNGQDNWYEIALVKLEEDCVVVTYRDITEQKNAHQQMERQKNLLKNILKYSPSGISVIEVVRNKKGEVIDGKTIIANESAAIFTGIAEKDILKRSISQIDASILQSETYQKVLSTLKTGKPLQTQFYFQPNKKWLELSVARMDEDHLINVFMDVTPAKEAQLNLEKTVDELKRTNANLEEFTYAASHDLKEPIRKIRLFSDRLRIWLKNRLNEEEEFLFGRLVNAAERMQLLVDDLLAYSHITMQQPSAYIEEIDLNKKIALILGDLELQLEEKHAIVQIEDELPKIKGHRRQIQQLFQNIIGNALKYSKPDVVPIIKIRCRTVKGKNLN